MSNAHPPGHDVHSPYKYTARLDADAPALGYVLFVPYPLPVLEKWTKLRTLMPWSMGLRGRFPWRMPRTHAVRLFCLRHTSSNLISTPVVRVRAEVLSLALPAGHSRKPKDPIHLSSAVTLKSGGGSADACANEGEVNVTPPTPSLIHSVLGNCAFAVFLISLAAIIVFSAATWVTVLRDARSMRDQVLSNVTGVSLPFCFNGMRVTNCRRRVRYQYSAIPSN